MANYNCKIKFIQSPNNQNKIVADIDDNGTMTISNIPNSLSLDNMTEYNRLLKEIITYLERYQYYSFEVVKL